LLDEPLSNLDANLRIQMRRDILALQRKLNLTTIFVTHDQEEANTTSDRMAVLNNGILQQVGAPIDLYDAPANTFVASFLGTANILKGEMRQSGKSSAFITQKGMEIPVTKPLKNTSAIAIRPQNIFLRTRGEKPQSNSFDFDGVVSEVFATDQFVMLQA